MQSPSNSQLKAIKHKEGPMLVMAGPGSGKTFVMIQRILYLTEQKKVDPDKILVISFSRAATMELRHRYGKLKKDAAVFVHFSTFHACFFHILKETHHYTSKDIIQNYEKREIIKTLLFDTCYNSPQNQENYISIEHIDEKTEELLHKISYYKNKGRKEMQEKEDSWFVSIFLGYNRLMHERHKLDFDDMGLLCLRMFRSDPGELKKWQQRFEYFLIDEYQDINEIQFRLMSLLAGKRNNIFVVGDDDQSIYGFRGASPSFMLEFEKYYPDAKKVLLETNFRCSGNIVGHSLKVIGENKYRLPKEIVAFHEPGDEVIIKDFLNYHEEYKYIVDRIQEFVKGGREYGEMVCIFRTNSQMMLLADVLTRNKIPLTMKEQCKSIFRHFVARDILHYMRFLKAGRKRKDFLHIMNKPQRYLSRNACPDEIISWERLRKYYQNKSYMVSKILELEKMEAWIQRLDLYGAIYYLRKSGGYEKYLKEYCSRQGLNWDEIKDILEFIHMSTKGVESVSRWEDEIAEYEKSLVKSDSNDKGVRMMTMHACKGLEFPYVFLPDCNEGRVPHNKAVLPEEIEEERRMFYVAMTRAKEKLEILFLQDKHKKLLQKSRFLLPLVKDAEKRKKTTVGLFVR